MIELPQANWPKESDDWKVVQFYIEGEPYLRFGSFPQEYHKSIIMKTASSLRKECSMEKRGSKTLPVLESEWYKIPGMGSAKIDVETKTAVFLGNSFDYEIGIDAEHLEKIKPFCPEWNIKYR